MTLADLRALFRIKADDVRKPYLWDDTEVDGYLNEAESEAAERASLIYDDTSTAATINVVAGTTRYALAAALVRLDYAELDDQPLEILDQRESGPRGIVMIPGGAAVELNFTPTADGTLRLGMYRLPVHPMAEDADEPEIHPRHHAKILDWALHLAYLKRDSEAYSEENAAVHEATFTANFGQRVNANVARKQRERRRHVVRCKW